MFTGRRPRAFQFVLCCKAILGQGTVWRKIENSGNKSYESDRTYSLV